MLITRLRKIVRVNAVVNRTVVVDSDWRFDNLCGSHLQSQSELYHVSWWYYTLVIDLIGQLSRDVIGRLSVKPWCYWLWRLVCQQFCTCSTLFGTFLCCPCTTTTWNILMRPFVRLSRLRDIFLFLFLPQLGWGPLEFNAREIHLRLTF